MGKDAPTPPNPFLTAAAQTGTNVSTAVANAYLSQVNQNTPEGSLSYAPTNQYQWTDPATGQTYTIPTFTATQTLTPQGQAIKNQQLNAQQNLAGIASSQSAKVSGILSSNVNPAFNSQQYLAQNPDVLNYAMQNGLDPAQFAAQHYTYSLRQGEGRQGATGPQAGSTAGIQGIPAARTSYDPGGAITTSYGPGDFSQDRQNVQDALMQRLNPSLQQNQQALQQQLADQGIRYGSTAYNNAMLTNAQAQNDARLGVISQAGQEQQRMMDMAAQRAGFQNAAQQQQYTQNAQLASFQNAGNLQNLQQQQAGFNAQQAARNQYLQETFALRNQPLNEVAALLSGSQIQQPNFVNTPGSQIPTTDIAGLINQNFNQQFQNYQQQSTNTNQLIGGILGLGAGALKASDERVKENIVPMGSVFAAKGDENRELPIYQYSYKADPASTRHIGPMAQDVEKIDRGAVKTIGGVKHIDTGRVMGSILRAA